MHDFEIYISILIPHIEYINENKRNYSDNFKLKKKKNISQNMFLRLNMLTPGFCQHFL